MPLSRSLCDPRPGDRPRSPRTAPAAGRRRAGFTFIELLVVITIIGLMSSIVVANLDGLTDRSTLNATAREFGNTLLAIRDQAAIQQREINVEIDVENQRWRIVDIPPVTDVPDPKDREEATYEGPWAEPGRGVILDSIAFSKNDSSRRGKVMIGFDADGQLVPSGFVVFFRHVNGTEEDGVSVEVTGLTGLVDYAPGKKRSEEVRGADDF